MAALLVVVGLSACRQDMHDQPKYEPLEASAMFADRLSARPLVEGTVARGQLNEDEHFYTGKIDGVPVETFPYPITREIVDRGHERYDVFCAPCHDRAGGGRGMVVRRGYRQPPAFSDPRLMTVPPGYFFDVMTNGFGVMPDYRAQIPPADRWAIAAYIRALQRLGTRRAGTTPQPAMQEQPAPQPNPQQEPR
jgi:mono/diheme cytochrome c family protein